MKLTLMKMVCEADDEDQQNSLAPQLAARWLSDITSCKLYRASANFVYAVETPSRPYFLRFNHESERSAAAISAEVNFIRHLVLQGIQVSRPLASAAGNYIETAQTAKGTFHAVLFEELPGIELTLADMDTNKLVHWGAALGRLHAASHAFEPTTHPWWSDHLRMARREIPANEECALKELRAVEERLGKLAVNADSFGLIHFDFELDNLRWQDDQAGILDFDDCACYWFEADIAFALRDLFQDRASLVNTSSDQFRAFTNGYQAVQPLTEEAIERIPLFTRLHNLVTFAKLLRALDGSAEISDPAWAVKLCKRLHNKLEEYRQDFCSNPIKSFLA